MEKNGLLTIKDNGQGNVHDFHEVNRLAESGTRWVMAITAFMMVVEIAAGLYFNSMALLADGWHMSSHTMAIGLSVLAYAASRRYARDGRFAFGTWKIEILGGFASAIFLIGVAAFMVYHSLERILAPQAIHYREAVVVAVIGLLVNLACALILGKPHRHERHGHDDLNLKSAYTHVLADAATSLLAIAALAGGWSFGWVWLDPLMGIVGAVLIGVWAKKLLVETGSVLLDREMDHPIVAEIREIIEGGANRGVNRITDLHVWRAGSNAYYCVVSLDSRDAALTPDEIRRQLAMHGEIVHTTIELHLV